MCFISTSLPSKYLFVARKRTCAVHDHFHVPSKLDARRHWDPYEVISVIVQVAIVLELPKAANVELDLDRFDIVCNGTSDGKLLVDSLIIAI